MAGYGYKKDLKPLPRKGDIPYNAFRNSDSYKPTHAAFYPPGMTTMHSYMESRGGEYLNTLFAGLQIIVDREIARPIEAHEADEFIAFAKKHGVPCPEDDMRAIAKMGYWPARIRAVKEGSLVPVSNVLLTVESTDERFPWVANYLETMIQRVWYPTTVATLSYHCRKTIEHFTDITCENRGAVKFQLHDFGARGATCREQVMIGGAAHLFNFCGSDSMDGVEAANHYYSHDMSAWSVRATEHSTVTSWGGKDHEVEAFTRAVMSCPMSAILSFVIDSYDAETFIERCVVPCKDLIIQKNLKLVLRPDSGDPIDMIVKISEALERAVGVSRNKKSFKVFHDNFGIIYGDSMTPDMIHNVLYKLMHLQYATSNYVFGMGGKLLQGVTRDTQKFAIKCSHITRDGKSVDVFKDPKSDPGKKSKRGRLDLQIKAGKYETVQAPAEFGSELDLVYEDGKIYRQQTLADIRKRAHGEF